MILIGLLASLALQTSHVRQAPGVNAPPDFLLEKWSATVGSCHPDRLGVSVRLRFETTIRNTGSARLIVPKNLSATGLAVSASPYGPAPWSIDSETFLDLEWSFGTKPPQRTKPEKARFWLLDPGKREKIRLDVTDSFSVEEGRSSQARIGISVGFQWDAGRGTIPPATAETAARWRRFGALVYGAGATDWVAIDVPAECRMTVRRNPKVEK
jgi:hypothetical protein